MLPESYRARTGGQRRLRRSEPLGQRLGRADQRPPELLAGDGIAGGENLAAASVEHGQPPALAGRLAEAAGERVERADAAQRQAAGKGERPRGGDPDPQPGEGAGADPDRDPLDRPPTPCRRDRGFDLPQQSRRVQRRAALGGADQRLVQDLSLGERADRGVAAGRIEAEDGQRRGTKKLKRPTRLPLTNQVTRCLPGMLVVILLT